MRMRAGLLLGSVLAMTSAMAQDKKPEEKKDAQPMALLGARVAGHDGPVNILISKGKIRAIDARAGPVPGMMRVNVSGARVAPGRIDAFSSLGEPDPRGNCLDAFDSYDAHALERALAGGVTTAVITPLRSAGISGLAAVIKLTPGATLEERTVVKESAVCMSVGLGNQGPTARAQQIATLHKTFLGAQAYKDAWLDYEEELEKYAEELKKPKKPEAKGAKPGPPARMRRGMRAGPRGLRPGPPGPKGAPPPTGKPGAKKPTGPKKPKRPRRDSAKALLVRVLDGELPLRVEAHRASDIVNCLQLQKEFGFKLILEGATEGHLLADVLAKREVPVILGPQSRSTLTGTWFPQRFTPANPAILHAAGVEIVFGTDWWTSTPHLQTNARIAVGAGLNAAAAEDAVTHGVARVIGLGDRLGKVAVGYDADLIITRTDALGAEQVRGVIIDGEIVYRKQK